MAGIIEDDSNYRDIKWSMDNAMKILIIDPRCTDESSSYYYVTGLASGLSKYADVELVSVYNCHIRQGEKFKLHNMFYRISEKMGRGKLRQVLRGVEYIYSYLRILHMAKLNDYDVIHIEWPIVYKVDNYFYRKLKKCCKLFSIKAHNVLPHSTGGKFIPAFRKIYSIPDKIILHGEGMLKEFNTIFPEYREKACIQKHGIYMGHDIDYIEDKIEKSITDKIARHKRIYLFLGRIDEDKGVERLVKIWRGSFREKKNSLLVIAGKISEGYDSFKNVEQEIRKCNNILYIPGYVDNNTSNYLFSRAELIVLPYLKGSMSGVVFTASEFNKPVLATIFGSVQEYVQDGFSGFVVDNEDEEFERKLLEIDNSISDRTLEILGNNLHQYFVENLQWDVIAKKLMESVYVIEDTVIKERII